jgi:large subunit ribosomal protein L3
MVSMLLGRKIAMTQVWDKDGNVQPVTVIKCGPCRVVQVKKKDEKDGYAAVQLGFEEIPAKQGKDGKPGDARANKPMLGHFKKHGAPVMRELREVRVDGEKNIPAQGDILKVDAVFGKTTRVDVIGTTKGRGFQGCMKRHKFQGGRATHGSKNHREPGAIGQNQWGHHIIKGKRLPGHFGDVKRTTRNLVVVKIEAEHDLIYVAGPVAGARNGLVFVRQAVRK